MSQWGLSTIPFAWELYADMRIPLIPHFCSIYFIAATNGFPLSVTIQESDPHLQIMSSYNHSAIFRALSFLIARASAQDVKASRPWTIFWQPFDASLITITSACNIWNIDGVCVTCGGTHTNFFCLSWQGTHEDTNHFMSRSISGHQNLCTSSPLVAKNPLWPLWSCAAVIIYILFSLGMYNRCWDSWPLWYILSSYQMNLFVSLRSRWYFWSSQFLGLYVRSLNHLTICGINASCWIAVRDLFS